MDVDQAGGLGDYELKLNSYDLGVDIELNDAVQRLRFEHPEVRCVVIKSGKDNVFCAGANIRMLGKSTHGAKVNFCKFTNETRLAIEDASEKLETDLRLRHQRQCGGGGTSASRSPPITSCWSTTAARRWRCRRRRCWRCCPAPAGSPASPTSARCGATAPTSSARRGGHPRHARGGVAAGRRGGAELEMEGCRGGARQ